MQRQIYTSLEMFENQNRALGTRLPVGNISVLGEKLEIQNQVIPNRLACQAMEGCDGEADGRPGEWTRRRYLRFASGGAGLIWFEATAVLEEARANPRQLWIRKENTEDFKRLLDEIRETALRENGYVPLIIMQATHSGRYSKPEGRPAPLIAYNNPLFEGENPIDESRIVTDEYLQRLTEKMGEAAHLAETAGFDGVDIKCCHRYLASELLSAYNRPGQYGGSLENRTRLLRESVQAGQQMCSENFIVTTRMNLYDGFPYPYGFGAEEGKGIETDLREAKWLLQQLEMMGVPLMNLTMGNPYVNPHVNRPFASGGYEIEEHPLSGVARMLLGIGEVRQGLKKAKVLSSALSFLGAAAPFVAAGLLEEDKMDLAGFGRMAFAYPDFAKDILKNGGLSKEKLCLCCSKCSHIMRFGGRTGCVIRDKEIYAQEYKRVCGGGK